MLRALLALTLTLAGAAQLYAAAPREANQTATSDSLSRQPRFIQVNEGYSEQERRAIERHYYGGLNLIDDLLVELNRWQARYGGRPAWEVFADSVRQHQAALAADLAAVRKLARTGYDPSLPKLDQRWEPSERAARRWLESLDARLHLRTTVERIRDENDPTWPR